MDEDGSQMGAEEASEPAVAATGPGAHSLDDPSELDERDREWLRSRSALMPIMLGLVGLVGSLLLLGLLFGPLGLRASVDLWRTGTRRMGVLLGGVLSAGAIVASIVVAMLWGSILMTVLLGRDAFRVAERWRGRTVEVAVIEGLGPDGDARSLAVGSGAESPGVTFAVLFVDLDSPLTGEAVSIAVDGAARVGVPLVVAAPGADEADAAARIGWGDADRSSVLLVGGGFTWPEPLGEVAAYPTTVVVGADGVVAGAYVGLHSAADLALLLERATADGASDGRREPLR